MADNNKRVAAVLETDVESRTMAGALSENAPRPVSVVTVDGGTVDNNAGTTDEQQPQQQQVNYYYYYYLRN